MNVKSAFINPTLSPNIFRKGLNCFKTDFYLIKEMSFADTRKEQFY